MKFDTPDLCLIVFSVAVAVVVVVAAAVVVVVAAVVVVVVVVVLKRFNCSTFNGEHQGFHLSWLKHRSYWCYWWYR